MAGRVALHSRYCPHLSQQGLPDALVVAFPSREIGFPPLRLNIEPLEQRRLFTWVQVAGTWSGPTDDLQNQTVTFTAQSVPKHTHVRLAGVNVDGYNYSAPFPIPNGIAVTAKIGGHDLNVQYGEGYGPIWMPSGEAVAHTDNSLTFELTGSGFTEEWMWEVWGTQIQVWQPDLSLVASPNITTGETGDVIVHVSGPNGQGAEGVEVTLSNVDGEVIQPEVTTKSSGADGNATFKIMGLAQSESKATFAIDGVPAYIEPWVHVMDPTIDIGTEGIEWYVGQKCDVAADLTDATGQKMAHRWITFSGDTFRFDHGSDITNENGRVTDKAAGIRATAPNVTAVITASYHLPKYSIRATAQITILKIRIEITPVSPSVGGANGNVTQDEVVKAVDDATGAAVEGITINAAMFNNEQEAAFVGDTELVTDAAGIATFKVKALHEGAVKFHAWAGVDLTADKVADLTILP